MPKFTAFNRLDAKDAPKPIGVDYPSLQIAEVETRHAWHVLLITDELSTEAKETLAEKTSKAFQMLCSRLRFFYSESDVPSEQIGFACEKAMVELIDDQAFHETIIEPSLQQVINLAHFILAEEIRLHFPSLTEDNLTPNDIRLEKEAASEAALRKAGVDMNDDDTVFLHEFENPVDEGASVDELDKPADEGVIVDDLAPLEGATMNEEAQWGTWTLDDTPLTDAVIDDWITTAEQEKKECADKRQHEKLIPHHSPEHWSSSAFAELQEAIFAETDLGSPHCLCHFESTTGQELTDTEQALLVHANSKNVDVCAVAPGVQEKSWIPKIVVRGYVRTSQKEPVSYEEVVLRQGVLNRFAQKISEPARKTLLDAAYSRERAEIIHAYLEGNRETNSRIERKYLMEILHELQTSYNNALTAFALREPSVQPA